MTFIKTYQDHGVSSDTEQHTMFSPKFLGRSLKSWQLHQKKVSCCFLFLLIGFRSVMTRIHGDPIAAVWGPSQGSTVHVQYGKRHRWTSEGASPNITIYLYIIPKQASFNTGCIVALATVQKLFGPQRAPPGSLWFDLAVLFLGSRQPLRSTQQKRTTRFLVSRHAMWSRAVWALHHESPCADLLLLRANLHAILHSTELSRGILWCHFCSSNFSSCIAGIFEGIIRLGVPRIWPQFPLVLAPFFEFIYRMGLLVAMKKLGCPPPGNSGKWRFTRNSVYLASNNPGGDCHPAQRDNGTTQNTYYMRLSPQQC